MKFVVNIDLSQQAISKFPLSEVKINFIRNFEIFETYCILEYDKTSILRLCYMMPFIEAILAVIF